jgi:polygalacturonase
MFIQSFKVLIICILFLPISIFGQVDKIFNIVDFGAVNDTNIVSTTAVQKAIDMCSIKGGIVRVPLGRFVIGTIKLKSNVELKIEQGGELLGSTLLSEYSTDIKGSIEAPAFNKCLVYADNSNNIKITGKGTINGRGYKSNFPVEVGKTLGERPMLIRFVNCSKIKFSEITLKNSASWCTHLVDCQNIDIQSTVINSSLSINNDGFDLDGCKNVLIENCNISSGDDAICPKSTTDKLCENIIVRNCKVISHTAAFKCGTSSRGGFKNIKVTNCDFSGTKMGAIKLLLVDGGILEDIDISDIVMNNVEGPIFIRLGNRGRTYDKPTEQVYNKAVNKEGAKVGSIKNIKIRNIKAVIESKDINKNCIMITGIPDHYIENILLENIDITYPGGGTKKDAKRIVEEDIARYPEQFFFGVLPAWGAYIRHAKNITFKNLKLSIQNREEREKIVLLDVKGFKNEK